MNDISCLTVTINAKFDSIKAIVDEIMTLKRYRLFPESEVPLVRLEEVVRLLRRHVDTSTDVVRCNDCTVPHNEWTGCPKLGGLVTSPEFYCAFGERDDLI